VIQDYFVPVIVRSAPDRPSELLACLQCFKGNPFAKAALETAWWSLWSAAQSRPLAQLLGGTRDRVSVGADFQIYDDTKRLIEDIGIAIEHGYPRVKLKVAPGKDIDVVRQVRERYPDLVFHIDCNSGYTLAQHASLFQEIDNYGLAMIEQPLAHDDLLDHARLQALLDTPICLDESITSTRKFRQALDIEACRAVNIKPGRVGGLGPAKEIHDLAMNANVLSWVGGMLESGVGVRIALALSTLGGFNYPADIFPSDRIHVRDIASPRIEIPLPADVDVNAILSCPMEIDLDALRAMTVESYRWGDGTHA
jgi:O-succinylbenzoate synthase